MKRPLDRQWRLIAGLALFGLLFTAVVAACAALGLDDLRLVEILVVLCLPSLMSMYSSEIMKDYVGAFAIWLFIGVLNAGLYAVVGAALAGLLTKRGQRDRRLASPMSRSIKTLT
jgi:hypothetical protein